VRSCATGLLTVAASTRRPCRFPHRRGAVTAPALQDKITSVERARRAERLANEFGAQALRDADATYFHHTGPDSEELGCWRCRYPAEYEAFRAPAAVVAEVFRLPGTPIRRSPDSATRTSRFWKRCGLKGTEQSEGVLSTTTSLTGAMFATPSPSAVPQTIDVDRTPVSSQARVLSANPGANSIPTESFSRTG